MKVICNVEGCTWNFNGECTSDVIVISDNDLRADGFYPRCKDYEEDEEVEE